MLSNCNELTFPVNDNIDMDGDANLCETIVTLSNSAEYTSDLECDISALSWVINVDIDMDGTIDIEYRSNLPVMDTIIDDTNGNGIPDLYIGTTLSGESQEIEVGDLEGPSSTHSIIWQVSDACGIVSECEQIFYVLDMKSPIPYCVSLSTVLIDGPYDIEVYAEDLNVGSFDNCTPSDELRFSFSDDSIVPRRLITCDDVINSPVELDFYVWDNQDNIDYCTVFLTVITGPTVCCFPYLNIEGYVKTEDDKPIHNAEVKLYCNLPEYPKSEFTDADGYYTFAAVQAEVPGCYITVDKEDEYITNVSTLDLVKIMRHILGIQSFTTPYQRLASDVTGDDKVKASDLLMHRKLILGVISEFPANSPWIFLDASYQFAEPHDPWGELNGYNEIPYHIILSPGSESPYNFRGVKLGNIVN
jgi:hypothetical protein